MDDPKNLYFTGPLASNSTIKIVLFWTSLFILIGMGYLSIFLVWEGWSSEAGVLAIGMISIILAFELNRRNNIQLAGSLPALTLTLMITGLAHRSGYLWDGH